MLSIALVDSLNPSAIVLTLYLLTTAQPVVRSLTYVLGIFSTYFVIGILVSLGLGNLINNIFSYEPGLVGYIVQLFVAIGFIIVSFRLRVESEAEALRHKPSSLHPFYTFLAGVTITFVESTTAIPYLAAIGTLSRLNLDILQLALILFIYNVIFVLPPILLILAYAIKGGAIEQTLNTIRHNVELWIKKILRVVLLGFGILLLTDSIGYFFGSPIF